MHIVYLVENIDVAGGIERSLTTRVNYLIDKYGYNITIVCTEKRTGVPYYNLNNKVKIFFLEPLKSKKTVFGRLLLRFNQAKFIANLNADIIITVKYSLHNLFFQFIRSNQKLVSEIREPKELYDVKTSSFKRKLNSLLRNRVFKKQDLMIVLTEADKRNWGYENIVVVPNPKTIESAVVSTLESKQVLALGRLDSLKAFDKLIEAWGIIVMKHPDWRLKICGEGTEYENLIRKVKDLNLEGSVTLTNQFVPVIPEFLNSSIFVSTSQFEAFGNVLVEAKICGVPIVAFDAPNGPREIIKSNEDGYLVKLNNINELAKKISFLMQNPKVRIEMGINARKNSDYYNVDNILATYNSALLNIK